MKANDSASNVEADTVRFLLITIRRFFSETRRGVMAHLLFHILQGCEEDSALGGIVDEFVWSSWTIHDNEEVSRLMDEAAKLSEVGKFDRSNAAADKVLEIDGGHFEALNCKATNQLLRGSLLEAAGEIQKVLAFEPRHFGALRGLGLLRMKLKDYSGALVAFESAARINPTLMPRLRDNMAVCHAAENVMLL